MEIQSLEKHQDNTSIGDYQGRSIVECDFKSSARESNVKCNESTQQLMQAENLLKQKEREVELWEEKYNKLKGDYAKLKNETEKSLEVSSIKCFCQFYEASIVVAGSIVQNAFFTYLLQRVDKL